MSVRSENYIRNASRFNRTQSNLWQIITALSLLVILGVFWGLKLTGITLAGEAFCGHSEHVHSEECEQTKLICPLQEAEDHVHSDDCYEMVACPLEEHVHVESCYSDITADLETEEDWEASLGDIDRQTITAKQVVAVAKSQLGVTESVKNFEVDAHGIRRGITRYGQWYGNPYGDWSAMFASFCLHYAGVDAPANAGPESMRLEWVEQDLYRFAEESTPRVGDLLFLNMDDPETEIRSVATFVAVITHVEDGIVTAIAGDVDGVVEEIAFEVDAPRIIGYGVVPEVSGYAPEIQEPPVSAPGDNRYIWLDGTCGGLMSLGGSDNTRYTAKEGGTLTLPISWKSPDKYNYVLAGWYDLRANKRYEPGAVMSVTQDTVLYAEWKAATYDIGKFNEHVTDTVSTNNFITTRVFDYSALFNILSERVNLSVNSNSHSETWQLLTSGNNPYNGEPTLDFIFRDWDRGDEDISYPQNHDDRNNPTSAGSVYSGLYTATLRELLFNPETEVLGKQYLGEGDHLFQLCTDPNDEYYGYYYYNSERNAASYNQSDQRFYVYDYLECTRDSAGASDEGKYSDFLPLNSPYANTNGKNVVTYSYDGINGEYVGTTHYMYDTRYNDSNNTTSNVGTNFWFGMSAEAAFYLPLQPGTTDALGNYGNKDVYGNDMHFRFTGDDDVWVLVDGTLILDLGGLHGRESGDINFSTGTVTVNGVVDAAKSAALKKVTSGEHTLTLLYLERGSSMSNCAIYFNLAPRFEFAIQKEDVLTREVLNGAQFSVYTDMECTKPAELWVSKEAHDNGDPATNVFTVKNGVARMWGMSAGNSYYIRETKPPDDMEYSFANGLICITFDQLGTAAYNVKVVDEGEGVSPGFIVHGFRIDTETQQAYIVATNAPEWVEETTVVEAMKHWNDGVDHTGTPVTVYLTVTDPDGVVRRLQEAELSADNNWMARWENLPKYWRDGVTPIDYGVEESYVSGYYSTVQKEDGSFEVIRSQWQSTTGFTNGKTYLLKNANGQCLSTQQYAEDTGYKWVSEEEAKNSDLALWVASVVNNTVRLTNHAGQTITFYYGNGSPTDFFALNQHLEDNNRKQYLAFTKESNGITLKYSSYYMANSLNSSQKFNNTQQSNQALRITPYTEVDLSTSIPIEDQGFLITNTPLDQETSLRVYKEWVIPSDRDAALYEQLQVTFRLYANGSDTGRTVTLTLKNGWNDVFRGLPYVDDTGQPITYTVKEVNTSTDWVVTYGEVLATGGAPPNYAVTVTNTYREGGPILPATGSPARLLYILCGGGLMLSSLVYGLVLRRKRERRRE